MNIFSTEVSSFCDIAHWLIVHFFSFSFSQTSQEQLTEAKMPQRNRPKCSCVFLVVCLGVGGIIFAPAV